MKYKINPVSKVCILLLPTCTGIELIDINTVIRIEAISNYSKLYFINGKTLVVAKVLRWFGEQLSLLQGRGYAETQFIRIHRTHLINKSFIYQYTRGEGGKVELCTGEWINVAKRKKTNFLKSWYTPAA